MLIKGGANYSYDQINDDLIKFLVATLPDIKPTEDYKLAVVRFITSNQDSSIEKEDLWLKNDDFGGDQVGLRIRSEHEDDCWCTVELCTEKATAAQAAIEKALTATCKAKDSVVGKGSRPDFLRFDSIPVNFKGALMVPDLSAACLADAKASPINGK